MFKVVIVDDEPSAIDNLKWELENFSNQIKVVDTFTSPDEAIHGINYLKPDCVFLDIEMPGKDGFTLLKNLTFRNFHLVITTAYENYALRAFKENAIDYLLKPIDNEDLARTVARLKKRDTPTDFTREVQRIVEDIIEQQNSPEKIALPLDGKIVMVAVCDIILCKSNGNYTELFVKEKGKLLLSKNLKQVSEMLVSPYLIRVHQSYFVNIKQVKEFNKKGSFLLLNDNQEIPVSRSYKSNLIEKLKAF